MGAHTHAQPPMAARANPRAVSSPPEYANTLALLVDREPMLQYGIDLLNSLCLGATRRTRWPRSRLGRPLRSNATPPATLRPRDAAPPARGSDELGAVEVEVEVRLRQQALHPALDLLCAQREPPASRQPGAGGREGRGRAGGRRGGGP